MKRLTIDFVREEFKKEGYILKTTVYKNAHEKLNYICPIGHKNSITWANWQQGKRCRKCSFKKLASLKKPSIKHIRQAFLSEGYILLVTQYENNTQKLEYICPNGHEHSINWSNWVGGKRCPYCYFLKVSLKVSGPGHPNWKGGISCEPYCDVWLDKDFKESIKQRDGYKCMNPDCWGTAKRLAVHHIDYVKKNCNPKNLVVLCTSCNSRANKDCEWHTAWYQAIMYMRYGVIY